MTGIGWRAGSGLSSEAMTALVLLPGMDGTGDLFEPLLRELPAGWRPVVVRYLAFVLLGESSRR